MEKADSIGAHITSSVKDTSAYPVRLDPTYTHRRQLGACKNISRYIINKIKN